MPLYADLYLDQIDLTRHAGTQMCRVCKVDSLAELLEQARALARETVETMYVNGLFKGHAAKPYYQANDGVGFLLYALLELDAPERDLGGAF